MLVLLTMLAMTLQLVTGHSDEQKMYTLVLKSEKKHLSVHNLPSSVSIKKIVMVWCWT